MQANEMVIDAKFAAATSGAFWRTQAAGVHPDKPAGFRYTGLSSEPQRLSKVA
jgi:hypothetical protein